MKKNKLIAFAASVSFVAGLFFTSCHDNIYSLIEKEVAIDNSGLNGDILYIARCNDYLFLSNGEIYGRRAKSISEIGGKNWKKTSMPVSGSSEFNVSNRVPKVASDDSYVYALALYHEEGDNGENQDYKREIWAAKTDNFPALNWEKVDLKGITDGMSISEDTPAIKIIYDNKATKGRNAYATIAGKIYKLNGKEKPSAVENPKIINKVDAAKIMNCVKFNDEDYFSSYYALAANDKYLYYSMTTTEGSTNSASNESRIFYTDSEGSIASFDSNDYILSFSLTADYLFCGTKDGLERIKISPDKIPLSKEGFSNNGNSVISEHVYMTFVLDETKPMAETDLYCASTIYASISSSSDSYDNIGLYSCPAGSDWNRDGN